MATDFVATGSFQLGGAITLHDPASLVTALATDTSGLNGFFLSGVCEIKSIEPTQFLAAGSIGLYAPCVIDSIERSVTALVAAGSFGLSGTAAINSISPTTHVTALATTGHFSLSSKCLIGDERQITDRADFIATGGYRLSGAIALGSVNPPGRVTALAATGGFSMGGSCALDSPVATVTALAATISYILSGQAASGVVLPLVTAFVTTGGYILGSSGVEPEETVFEAWVLNGQAFEPAIFSAFRFNSFAQRGAQTFAAGEDGIYLLGGDDDAGESFHTGARIGPVNFGSDREKRMRSIQMGDCGPDTKVRVASEMGDRVFTPDIDSNRVVVSRDIQGREFTIDIQDFQELSHFEATVLKLARR